MIDHLSADELDYLKVVHTAREQADATLRSYVSYLYQKYSLGPQDVIGLDGSLKRAQERVNGNGAAVAAAVPVEVEAASGE